MTTEQRAEQRERVQKMSRVLWCQVCRRYTAHRYIGTQEFPGKAFHLYNCSHCGDTAAEEAA